MRKGFGAQTNSKNRTQPSAHFGTSTRGHAKKEGMFKDQMIGMQGAKLYHAAY